ncbi:MAG TPA: type IV pilus assembly protein PilM [Methylomusa anaerophila]|uniref:Competence protein A n=1 Tax=Methylomusa anaerophila TaxID=1930071 RepID=A0A348AQG7_9FIRM|nr:type IV pilus assembly protein PilM [Methylomusa anaerophila]BBB93315.1 competence protein A [Methylomusa anaerophila]HML86854.1 type IV pilus assembly protein PilM [Methylomusa anaerophila]
MNLDSLQGIIRRIRHWIIPPPASIVGIDIGSGFIKAAEVSFTEPEPVLKAAGIAKLPDETIGAGHRRQQRLLSDSIKQLLLSSGIAAREAVVAASGRSIFVREVALPMMSKEELKEAIKWDMEKYVPYETGSYYYDYVLLGPGNDAIEINVLIVAAPREIVDNLVPILKDAGCRILAVDIEPLAVVRTLPQLNHSLVIDIGDRVSQLTIFDRAVPVISRSIPLGGQNFTNPIGQALYPDPGAAENQYIRSELSQTTEYMPGRNPMEKGMRLIAEELVREARRTYEYYRTHIRETNREEIYLTGGGARLSQFYDTIAEYVGDTQVTVHDPLKSIKVSSCLDEKYIQSVASQLTVAIGLALRGCYD